jgi:hypothetical protein
VRRILRPEPPISQSREYPDFEQSRFGKDDELRLRPLTEEEAYLVGGSRDFRGNDNRQMYMRASAKRGSQLRRRGAIEACVFCGIPALPGTTAFAHIHRHDLHLSPYNDSTRVFCLCWHHHHGCYDQGYIATIELLRAEEIWIQNKRRPKPHPRDIAMMKRIEEREIVRQCAWTEKRVERRATFHPGSWMLLPWF